MNKLVATIVFALLTVFFAGRTVAASLMENNSDSVLSPAYRKLPYVDGNIVTQTETSSARKTN